MLSCEIPHVIANVSSSIEALSINSGPSYSRLMTELHLHPERLYELLYKDVILEKPDGQRDVKVDHNPKSYISFYEETCFQKKTSGAELLLQNRSVSLKKTTLKKWLKRLYSELSHVNLLFFLLQGYFDTRESTLL